MPSVRRLSLLPLLCLNLLSLPLVAAAPAAAAVPARFAPQDPAQEPSPQQRENALRATAFAAEAKGQYAEAAEAFLELSREAPDRVDWVVAAGRNLGLSGRFAEALDLLDEAHKRLPTAPDITAMLARTLLLRTEREAGLINPEILWADAAELAEQVLQGQPNHLDARLLVAQARYLLGDADEAVRQAELAAASHPDHPGSQVLLGRIALDRFTALLRRFEREQPQDRERAELVQRIDSQRKAARQAFTRAATLDPTRAHPHVALSQIDWLDGKRDEARSHLLDALALDPDVQADHGQLTDGLEPAQRINLYRDLRKRYEGTTNPRQEKSATLWFFEGRAAYDAQDWAAARDCFRRTEALDPAASSALYYHFFCAYQLADYDDAETQAAAFAAISAPRFADLLREQAPEPRAQIAAMIQWLGDRAYQQQHIEQSRDLNHVIACLKDSADAWNNHAFLCRETGRFEQAFTSYQYALEREPDSPQLWNDAAVILQYHLPNTENLKKARGMYEKAMELATKVLNAPDSSERARQFAQQAQQDAKANLAELADR